MSAIVAIFNRDGKPASNEVLEQMLAARPERAIDGQSLWNKAAVALAHQHFWITPEERGEVQPMLDSSGRYVLSCDARVDNRQELMAALGLDDYALSDSSLILESFLHWHVRCVEHLLGEFAFAIWDSLKGELFIATDALAARGLAYYLDQKLFLVASEINSLLAHPAIHPQINDARIAQYLSSQWDDQEASFYVDVHYLPPAHCMVISRESATKWRYWEFDLGARIRYRDDSQYAEHYLELLQEVVRCRLRVLGKVGISLSGGLDSTALAALIACQLPHSGLAQNQLISFSNVFEEFNSCDERHYIQPLIDRYGFHSEFILADDQWTLHDPDNWSGLRDFIHHDAFAGLYHNILDAAQGSDCRLLFTGMLGDGLYYPAEPFWLASMLQEKRFNQVVDVLSRNSRTLNIWQELWAHGLRPLAPSGLKRVYRRLRPGPKPWAHPGLHPGLVKRTGMEDWNSNKGQPAFSAPHQRSLYTTLTSSTIFQGMAAFRHVHNSHGLESVDPLYDRRLIEFALAIPADQLSRPYRSRWVLRNAMDNLLPELVLERQDKTSFYPLFEEGFFIRQKETVSKLLNDPLILEYEFVSESWLRSASQAIYEQYESDVFFLWLCVCLELWLKRYW